MSELAEELRQLVAQLSGQVDAAALSDETSLFGDGVALDSLTAVVLLQCIDDRYGVDVAGEDLTLDSLASFGTLVAFVADRRRR